MKKFGLGVLLLVLVAGVLWWTFDSKSPPGGSSGTAPLAYVPADTPYVFANIEPMPGPVVDKALRQADQMRDLYLDLLNQARKELAASDKPEDKRKAALLDALNSEFADKSPEQINEALGFGLDARGALYGIGLVPVLRIELAKPDNLRGFIARMEKAAGESLPTAKLGTLSYWSLQPDKAPLQVIAGIIDSQLVLTLAPKPVEPAVLRSLFGLDRPSKSLLQSGNLQALNTQLGFTPYGSGYIDSTRVLAAISGEGNAVENAFLQALDIKKPTLDPVCSGEYAALAQAWPRISAGYTRLDTEHNDSLMLIETRADIATELMKLRAPMPGLGDFADNALMSLALNFKVSALPAVVGKFAGDVGKSPWQCANLKELNEAFAQSKIGVNSPAVFAAGPVFNGIHAIVNSVELNLQSPETEPSGTGVILIGSDNPQSLIGMAKGFLPPLANLEIPLDGTVVTLPSLPGAPAGVQVHAASSDKVIGLAVGDAAKQALPELLSADPNRQPLLVIGLRSAFYTLLADAMVQGAQQDEDATPEAKAMLEKQAELMRGLYAGLFERLEMRLELSPRGIELWQTVQTP